MNRLGYSNHKIISGSQGNVGINIYNYNWILHLRFFYCILLWRESMTLSEPNQAIRRSVALSTAILSVGLIIIRVGVSGPA